MCFWIGEEKLGPSRHAYCRGEYLTQYRYWKAGEVKNKAFPRALLHAGPEWSNEIACPLFLSQNFVLFGHGGDQTSTLERCPLYPAYLLLTSPEFKVPMAHLTLQVTCGRSLHSGALVKSRHLQAD